MRSAVLILALLLVLGGVFYFAVARDRSLGTPAQRAAATSPATRRSVPTTSEAADGGVIGRTSGVKIQNRSRSGDQAGRVVSEFLFERLDPRKDGAVDVVRPQAWFYGRSGGMVTLDGASGTVAYSQAGDRADMTSMGSATPTSGTLRDVTISMFDAPDDAEPSMVATVPAVRFDAIDNRLATVDDVIDGRGVLAENVPVTVRGRDYEFDGYGLVMRWNDRDGRLENLVINRGERLLVRDVGRFTSAKPDGPQTVSRDDPPKRNATAPRPARPMTPAASPTTKPAPPPRPTTRAADGTLYHATFDRDVRVSRAGVEVARADAMNVVMPLSDKPAASTPAASKLTPSESTPRAKPNAATTRRAPRPTSHAASPTPATRLAEPLEIRWTGRLTVRPVAAEAALVADGTMVEFVGSPARVAQDGASVEGRLIHVEPDAGRVRVEPGGPVRAISLTGADGAQLRSRSALLVDRPAGRATIEGGGTLFAAPDKSSTRPSTQPANVRWSKRLELGLEDDGNASATPWLRAATIEGDARVEAEQFAMSGQLLSLGFDRPTLRSTPQYAESVGLPASDARQLRLVTARGGARIESGPIDERRSLAGDELRLGFAAGADGPALTTLVGTGNVTTIDADGTEFAADSVDVATRPTPLIATTQAAATQPADALAMLERLDARGAVRLKRADGTAASGNHLTLVDANGRRSLALDGAPARAGSARGEVVATRVEIDPITRDVRVPVAGRVTSAGEGSTMAVDWSRSMSLDAVAGACAIDGDVKIATTDAKGAALLALARRADIAFAPESLAATRPSAAATSRPAIAESVRSVLLTDDVDVTVDSADGRQSNIRTRVLNFDVANNLVTADEPGRMRMGERPAPTTAAATLPATVPTTMPATTRATALASTRPAPRPVSAAVAWEGKLRWQLDTGALAITGGVRVGYDRGGGRNDLIRVLADRLVGTLTPVDLRDAGATTRPSVELRTIRADGDVRVDSTLAHFDAATLDYDLSRTTAHASGDGLRDVQVYDSKNASSVSFGAVTWNVETGEIEDFRDIRGQLRR